jgi:ABC-type bacteriocin/lantibiotic exporter with double-glycine peptidase domain
MSAFALCLPQTSFAYVDPGTGAYVVQALVALAGATVFYITHPLELLRRVKKKLLNRKDEP